MKDVKVRIAYAFLAFFYLLKSLQTPKLFYLSLPLIKTKHLNNPTTSTIDPVLRNWFLLILLGLVWGSSYILIKKGLVAFSPIQLASLRVSISSIAFLPFFIYRFKTIDWSKTKYLLVVGFAGSFLPAFLFAFAQTEINSSMAGVLSSLTPLFTLVLGILFFKSPFILRKVIGVFLGLAGAIFLILFGADLNSTGNMSYGLLIILGCFFYATSVNTVKSALQEMNSLTLSATAFTLIGIPGILFLFFSGFFEVMQTHQEAWQALGAITLLALFGTVMASILFFRLVQLTTPVFASTVSYLIPIVSLFWGFADGETITIFHFIGMALILFGVYITRK